MARRMLFHVSFCEKVLKETNLPIVGHRVRQLYP